MNASDLDPGERFFYLLHDRQVGPLNLLELAAEYKYGHIGPETPVWRQGDTEAVAFRERPEFADLEAVSVEVIARRLGAINRGQTTPSRSMPGQGTVVVACLVVALILAVSFFMPSSAPPATVAPPPPAPSTSPASPVQGAVVWSPATGNEFSLECPGLLRQVASSQSGVIKYEGSSDVAGFGVDFANVSKFYSPESYQIALSHEEALYFEELGGEITSDHEFTLDEYQGHDFLFTKSKNDGPALPGGVRFLFGNGKVGLAWIRAKSDLLTPHDINRFLQSFQFN